VDLTFRKVNNITAYILIEGTDIGVVVMKDNVGDTNWQFRFLTSNTSSFGNVHWHFGKRINYIDQPNVVVKDVETFLLINSRYILDRIFE